MGYDVLTQVIELTDSNAELNQRLRHVAKLLLRRFNFESCSIYQWDDKDKKFIQCVSEGVLKEGIKVYKEKEGLAGQVKRLNRVVDIFNRDPQNTRWGKTVDLGIRGSKTIIVHPLKDETNWHGVIYLKSRRKLRLAEKTKKMLHVISKQLASTIKSEENFKRLEGTYKELHELKVRLINAEKLMALGELSSTLAHEIKTPLVSIGGFASRLKKKIEPTSPHLPYINQIVEGVKRLEGITNDILRFAEDKMLDFKPQKLNSIIDESMNFFKEACQINGIRVIKNLHPSNLMVMADAGQLKIAFDNLIANAVESMEQGGALTLTTKKNKDWIKIDVTDNGGGIDPKLVGNIFNPFFTTKRNGTGLGLTITNKIITKHKGVIEVANDYGRGMTFSVKLPCVKGC